MVHVAVILMICSYIHLQSPRPLLQAFVLRQLTTPYLPSSSLSLPPPPRDTSQSRAKTNIAGENAFDWTNQKDEENEKEEKKTPERKIEHHQLDIISSTNKDKTKAGGVGQLGRKSVISLSSVNNRKHIKSKEEEAEEEQREIATKALRRLSSIKCSHCGKRARAKAEFCSSCGASVGAVSSDTLSLTEFFNDTFWPIRISEVGEHTARVERGFWDQIIPTIGQIPLRCLTAMIWEGYLKQLKLRGCSARTQTLHQIAYSAALKYALHMGHIKEKHPLRTIKGGTKRTLTTVPLTAKEVLRLLDCASRPMHRALFGVCVGIGLRPSEVLRMQWEDIWLTDGTVIVRGTKTTNSMNRIPLTDIAKTALEAWWEREARPTAGLCFYRKRRKNVRTGRYLKAQLASFRGPLMSASLRAGIDKTEHGEPRRIFPYILRHSFATLAASSNPPVPLPVAQAVMRHTSSKMLLETYAKAGALVIRDGLKNFVL
eukprot:GHVS01007954.1.p1 GENE.GHVS01007954.1~~GHVS01007954.1.p1  ORF type:complete len:486 (+),score=66.16 GHVS01007954.1:110-1567(+)